MDNASVAPAIARAGDRRAAAMLSTWIMAMRPRSLGLSASPVLVGAALAWAAHRQFESLTFLAALLASICIQLGTNLHNDAADSERGGDGPDRVGPPRATALGLLSTRSVKRAAAICFGAAFLMGLHLVAVGGWPILLLGTLSILCGWGYTGGPKPIAYTPLGEVFVIAFFGIGAVTGTYWLMAGTFDAPPVVAGVALGLMAAAVLLVNNFRDRVPDARVGRRTISIVTGARWSRIVYVVSMLAPYALLAPISLALPGHPVWLALAAMAPALGLIHGFAKESSPADLNRILVRTVQVQLTYSLLLAAALLL